jgi:hypothetical protein
MFQGMLLTRMAARGDLTPVAGAHARPRGAGISRQALGIGGVEVRDAIGTQIEGDYPGYDYTARTTSS